MEQPIELTAETLWTEVAGRLKEALNDSTYRTWFGEVEGWEVTGWPYQVILRGEIASEWNDKEQKHHMVGKPRGRYQARKLGYATYPI